MMSLSKSPFPEGNAIVYCEGAFGTTNGKTAHGLVRRSERYRILSVIDRLVAGQDAGVVLDGNETGIPIVGSLKEALQLADKGGHQPTHFAIGLAPDGGRLPYTARAHVLEAIQAGLHIDSGLHDFLGDDPELAEAARIAGVCLRDIRRPPPRKDLHFFSGKIEEVDSLVVAMLGTDSAIGKRTTAWMLIDSLRESGFSAELIGTGQTSWMQGVRYGIVLDSLINDFVSGEIEHAVWSCWSDLNPDVIVLEGQGSLLNPAYPGGFELLGAGSPEVVVLQHAPTRLEYDGFGGYPLHPLDRQIEAIEVVSDRPVVAITLNHEGLSRRAIETIKKEVSLDVGLPVCDPLIDGCSEVVDALRPYLAKRKSA